MLAKAGVPYAKLVPFSDSSKPPRKPGRFKGQFDGIPDSVWFDPFYSDEELDAFACEDVEDPSAR